jgi:hypothetical protein
VYAVIVDYSAMAKDFGMKVHVVRSGPFKGQGVTGAPISEEYLEVEQDIVDQMAGQFIDAVAAGRGMEREKVAALANGRVWLGDDAKRLGLVDTVRMRQSKGNSKKGRDNNMVTELGQTAVTPPAVDEKAIAEQAREQARAEERDRCKAIREAFADDATFALEAIDEGLSVEAAWAEYGRRAKGREMERAKAKPDAGRSRGVDPIEHAGAGGDAAGGDLMGEARAMAKQEGVTVTEAIRRLSRSSPEMYRGFRERESRRVTTVPGGARRISR